MNRGFHGAVNLFLCGASVIPPSRRPVLAWIRNSAFYDVDGLAVQLGSLGFIYMDTQGQVASN